MGSTKEGERSSNSLANYGFDQEAENSVLEHKGTYKKLAEAYIETLHAWENDPKEKVTEIIEEIAKYTAEELPDAGETVIALVAETEPEAAEKLRSVRDEIIKKLTN